MKHSRFTKLFVLILSLALLIGSAVCVAASADEGADYGIKSVNIAHGDKIQVLIAVDAPNLDAAEAEQLTVTYTYNGETIEADYWKMMDIYKNGTLYPVFYTVGIAMKDIGEAVVAQVGNGAPMNISVAEYLYTKLYKDGYAFATEGEKVARKNLYLNLLDYGAQAQKVLWNNKHPEDQRVLVNQLNYVYAVNADVNGNGTSALLDKDGYLSIDYTGSDMLVGWNVITTEGIEFYYNNVYVDSSCRIVPVTVKGAGMVEDFNGEYTTDDGTTRYNEIFFASGTKAVSAVNGNATTLSGQLASVKSEDGRGNYLNVYSGPRQNDERAHMVNFPEAAVVTDDANVTIVEFDYKDNSNAYYDVELTFAGTVLAFGRTVGAASTSHPYIMLPQNEWSTIRLEAYFDIDVVQVYVNGVYTGSLTTNYNGAAADFTDSRTISFGSYNKDRIVDWSIDNFTFVQTTKEYVEVPYTPVKAGTTYDFEDQTAGVLGTNPDFTNYTFVDGSYWVKNNGSTHECEAGAEIITEDDGNKYFYMYAGKRVNTSTDRGWSFSNQNSAEKLVPDAIANYGVLELDMKIDNSLYVDGSSQGSGKGMINWSFYFGGTAYDSNTVRFDPDVSGTDIKLGGNTFMTFNAWYTVRLEFVAGENVINVYSKLRGEAEWSRSFTIPADATPVNGAGRMANISAGAFYGFDITGGNSSQMYSLSFDNISCYSTYVAPDAE